MSIASPPSDPRVQEERPHPPATAALDAQEIRSAVTVEFEPEAPTAHRVGVGFITSYTLAYTGFWLSVLTPVLIAIPLKVESLAGADASGSLGLVLGVGALVAMVIGPVMGRLSDRTTSRLGMRRPWLIVGALTGVLATAGMLAAPSIPLLLLALCAAQVSYNAAGAALLGVLPDQVSSSQRGTVSGLLGVSLPVGLVGGTSLVSAVSPDQTLMFMAPAVLGAALIVLFAVILKDRRLDPADKPAWSTRELLTTFWVNPRKHRDFGWAFASRFLVVLAYSFLTAFQAFYLLNKVGSSQSDIPGQVALATLVLSGVTVLASVLSGRLSDRSGRRKVFVGGAAVIYGIALFIVAVSADFNGFLLAMAVAGVGFGAYVAVDLALVTDVLPDADNVAKDMAVFNIASTLPQALAPALAPVILAVASGSYAVLYVVAGIAAVIGALAILPVKGVR
jgi:MFS family permease